MMKLRFVVLLTVCTASVNAYADDLRPLSCPWVVATSPVWEAEAFLAAARQADQAKALQDMDTIVDRAVLEGKTRAAALGDMLCIAQEHSAAAHGLRNQYVRRNATAWWKARSGQ